MLLLIDCSVAGGGAAADGATAIRKLIAVARMIGPRRLLMGHPDSGLMVMKIIYRHVLQSNDKQKVVERGEEAPWTLCLSREMVPFEEDEKTPP